MSNSRKRTSLVSIFLLSLFTAFIFGSQPAMASYEINLAIGWNLVSLPEQPTNTDIAEVTSSIHGKYESIWAYVNGSWKVYDPNHPEFSDLTSMEAGLGYWVNMSETGTLSGSGSSPSDFISLNTGWNLVGVNSSTSHAIAVAMQSIEGKYELVWFYEGGTWKVYDPQNPGFSDLTTISPGFAYWINANEPCLWSLPSTPEQISVVITSPTGEPFYVTSSSTVILSGLTGGTVDSVTWSSEQGGSGVATGTTEWTTSVIPLVIGDNNITVTAYSGSITVSEVITVTYNVSATFSSALYISESVLYVNEAKDVIFRIGIDPSVDLANLNLKLYKVDSSGDKISELGSLLDNGNLSNGDEIEQDGIFSGKFTLTEASHGLIFFRAFATVNTPPDEVKSEVKSIMIVPHLTPQEVQDAVSNADNAEAKYKEFLTAAKLKLKGLTHATAVEDAIEKTVKWLNEQPGIAKADAAEGDAGLWFVNSNGILGGLYIEAENQWAGIDPILPTKFGTKLVSIELHPNRNYSFMKDAFNGNDANKIGNANAIYVGPYFSSAIGQLDFNYGGWQQVIVSSCPTFDNPAVIPDNAVTLDTFKNLSNYGTILIATHGDSWYKGLLSSWKDLFGDQPGLVGWAMGMLSKPVISSGIKLAKDAQGNYIFGNYEDDLKSGKLAISQSGLLFITPSFFKFHGGTFPNSIISMTSCRGFYNSSLADKFVAKGAGAFFGYSDYVSGGYAANVSNTIFEEMLINGKTFKEAYTKAIADHGDNDNDTSPAFLRTKGNDNLIYSSAFANGSFETGNLDNWEKIGDGRVISKLGPALPTDGKYMSIISTGLGFTVEHGEIIQTFCVSPNATSLTFDWNFFSEEFLEWCGTPYQDWFKVTITDIKANSTTTIIERRIDDLCGSVTKVDNSFDKGDVYSTGWHNLATFDLTAYRGRAVKLTFSCNDVGDSIYDSAILVDHIVISTE